MRVADLLPVLVAMSAAAALGLLASTLAGRLSGRGRRGAPPRALAEGGPADEDGDAHTPLALRLYPLALAFYVFNAFALCLYPLALALSSAAGTDAARSLVGAGLAFTAFPLVAWLYIRRTRAAEWNP